MTGVIGQSLHRIVVALAVLGFALQAALPAWQHGFAAHIQAQRRLPAPTNSELAADLEAIGLGVMCGDLASMSAGTDHTPAHPSRQPQSDCPICACLSGSGLAMLPDATASLPQPMAGPEIYWLRDVVSSDKALLSPRSRGPPRTA